MFLQTVADINQFPYTGVFEVVNVQNIHPLPRPTPLCCFLLRWRSLLWDSGQHAHLSVFVTHVCMFIKMESSLCHLLSYLIFYREHFVIFWGYI